MTDSSVVLAAVNAQIAAMDNLMKENQDLKTKLAACEFSLNDRRAFGERMKQIHLEYKASVNPFIHRFMFRSFIQQRVRREIGSRVSLRDIARAFYQWSEENRNTRFCPKSVTINQMECEKIIVESYGAPSDGKTLLHIRLFYDDDAIMEFDLEKKSEFED